ncbi:hypothetical protein [Flexithrix dorotheae]|uniref:hypothetical protein n=1 Tax=Flexithrix dorotheae TaxID=70993 RepID=UPI0003709094|nr:hypothetical protein [Flexithrix dorotheae]
MNNLYQNQNIDWQKYSHKRQNNLLTKFLKISLVFLFGVTMFSSCTPPPTYSNSQSQSKVYNRKLFSVDVKRAHARKYNTMDMHAGCPDRGKRNQKY